MTTGFAAYTPNGSSTDMLGDELLPHGSSARSDFNALEQLLSPGFSLLDDQPQVFIAEYPSSMILGDVFDKHDMVTLID
ncbi:hypothetical protein N7474_007730 [Penicillium riverlandense]|uniref:uncharacterized protein n=1 Tax=Penicillium riverlandense TaxID=1903569 RepID=UPI0025495DB1|nr:uncharacterized protein N7474_007730 [Penicillium riverlandense]KAJ5811429.1 hypothetical protein N7474_007730 [Penicillium riverlandense]